MAQCFFIFFLLLSRNVFRSALLQIKIICKMGWNFKEERKESLIWKISLFFSSMLLLHMIWYTDERILIQYKLKDNFVKYDPVLLE